MFITTRVHQCGFVEGAPFERTFVRCSWRRWSRPFTSTRRRDPMNRADPNGRRWHPATRPKNLLRNTWSIAGFPAIAWMARLPSKWPADLSPAGFWSAVKLVAPTKCAKHMVMAKANITATQWIVAVHRGLHLFWGFDRFTIDPTNR